MLYSQCTYVKNNITEVAVLPHLVQVGQSSGLMSLIHEGEVVLIIGMLQHVCAVHGLCNNLRNTKQLF